MNVLESMFAYLYWSGGGGGVTGKVELRSTIARSSDIVLPGVCLHLNLVHRNSVNTPK